MSLDMVSASVATAIAAIVGWEIGRWFMGRWWVKRKKRNRRQQ